MNDDLWRLAEWTNGHASAAICDLRRVLPFGATQTKRAGIRFINESSTSRTIYLIHSGIVKISCGSYADHESALMLRFPGDLLGECSQLLKGTEFASATTMTNCLLSEIPNHKAVELLQNSSEAAICLAKQQMIERVRITSLLIESRTLTAEQRLFRLLRQLAKVMGVNETVQRESITFKLPCSESDLADLIGLTPKSFSRLKRKLICTECLKQNGSLLSFNTRSAYLKGSR